MLLVRRAARCPAGPALGSAHRPQPDPRVKSRVSGSPSQERGGAGGGSGPPARALGGACPGRGGGEIVATPLGRGQPAVPWRRADDAPITGLPRGARPAGSKTQAACLS